jgi:hypothetical protein
MESERIVNVLIHSEAFVILYQHVRFRASRDLDIKLNTF